MGIIVKKRVALHLKNQFLRFIGVGVFNTLLVYAVYALALALGLLYPVANFIALCTGILISFTTQSKFVFNRWEYRLFWRFLLSWALIYCANVAFIHQMIALQFNPYQAGMLALPANAVLSFFIQKHFVFARGGVAGKLPSSSAVETTRADSKRL